MARPLFVVTAPRSGSTFVVRLLDQHARVRMINELCWVPFLRRAFLLASTPAGRQIDDGEGFTTPGILPERHARDFAHSYMDTMQPFVDAVYGRIVGGTGDCDFFGDKVLSCNDLAFVLEHFPESTFVQLVRDPRDVVASTFAFQQKQAMLWDDATFATRVEHMERFLRETDEMLAGRERFELRYEDLMADVPTRTRAMFAFLGFEVTAEVQAFLDGPANALFSQHGTSASPARSIGRWRRDLTPEQQELANEVLAEQLLRLGYAAADQGLTRRS